MGEITVCEWIPKDDDEAIERYIRDGWDVRVLDNYHGCFSALATKKIPQPEPGEVSGRSKGVFADKENDR